MSIRKPLAYSASTLVVRCVGGILVAVFALSAAQAATLKGNVKNATTGRPAAGDDVILLELSQTMNEAARTKADPAGNYSFNTAADKMYVVRVMHQNVPYHQPVPPGTTTADVSVYDAAEKVDHVEPTIQIVRMQANKTTLSVSEDFVVSNTSTPPRTQSEAKSFRFELPAGAKLQDTVAVSSGGMPVRSTPQSDGGNAYYFSFPLRPGETRFEVTYDLPYSGKLKFDPKPLYPFQHFAVMLPPSMVFNADGAQQYQSGKYKDGSIF